MNWRCSRLLRSGRANQEVGEARRTVDRLSNTGARVAGLRGLEEPLAAHQSPKGLPRSLCLTMGAQIADHGLCCGRHGGFRGAQDLNPIKLAGVTRQCRTQRTAKDHA